MDHGKDSRYRIVVSCDGIPPHLGPQAALDIEEEFAHRPWHEKVECEWNGVSLLLTAENDYDAQGLALMDELSDAIAACIKDGFEGQIRRISAEEI